MIAVTLPPDRDRPSLARSAAMAEEQGFERVVLAEPPIGLWDGAAASCSMVGPTSGLELGVAVDILARHPLRIAEDVAVLQRIVGTGLWPILMVSSSDAATARLDAVLEHLGPDSRVRPRPSAVSVLPWCLCLDEQALAVAWARGLQALTAADAAEPGDGIYGTAPELRAVASVAPVMLVVASSIEEIAAAGDVVAAHVAETVVDEPWVRLATEGLE